MFLLRKGGHKNQGEKRAYRSTGLVVVQIHLLAEIPTALAGIDEFARELEAVADVVRATTPFPVPNGGG